MAERNIGSARANVKGLRQIEKEEKRKKLVLWSIVGFIVACFVGVAAVLGIQSNNSKDAATANVDKTPKNITSEGSFQLLKNGSINASSTPAKTNAKRTQLVFDFMCPGCGAFDRAMSGNILDKVKNGQIDLRLSPVAFLNQSSTDQYSNRAANAFITVAEEDPSHAYAFMTAMYKEENQPKEAAGYVPVSDDKLAKLAKSVGVKESTANNFKNHYYVKWIEKRTNTLNSDRKDLYTDGISTPGVFVGGKDKGNATEGAQRVDFSKASSFQQGFEQALANAK